MHHFECTNLSIEFVYLLTNSINANNQDYFLDGSSSCELQNRCVNVEDLMNLNIAPV